MQLNFARDGLIQMLRIFIFLILVFAGEIAVATWVADARRIMLFGSGLIALPIALWGFAKVIWLIRSKVPAATVTERGIELNGLVRFRTVPWSEIDAIAEAEFDSGKAKLNVVEITRHGGRPIRLPIRWLSNSRSEIDRWIAAGRSRLAA